MHCGLTVTVRRWLLLIEVGLWSGIIMVTASTEPLKNSRALLEAIHLYI